MMLLWPSKPRVIYDPASIVKSITDAGKQDDWVVQIKKNGSRALVQIDEEKNVRIFDRHNTTLTISFERDWSSLSEIFPAGTLLDGELIGRKQGEVSNKLYLWDAPIIGGEDLTDSTYEERYLELQHFYLKSAEKEQKKPESPFFSRFLLRRPGDLEMTPFCISDLGSEKGIPFFASSYSINVWEELYKRIMAGGSGGHYKTQGEDEGLVFKNIKKDMAWSRFKTKDVAYQLKYLVKYDKR